MVSCPAERLCLSYISEWHPMFTCQGDAQSKCHKPSGNHWETRSLRKAKLCFLAVAWWAWANHLLWAQWFSSIGSPETHLNQLTCFVNGESWQWATKPQNPLISVSFLHSGRHQKQTRLPLMPSHFSHSVLTTSHRCRTAISRYDSYGHKIQLTDKIRFPSVCYNIKWKWVGERSSHVNIGYMVY